MNNFAVVFGATGLVGRELMAELLGKGEFEKVIMVVRKIFLVLNPKIELVQVTDFSQLRQFREKLRASTYFCCVGSTIRAAGSKQAFRKVDLEIPLHIAGLAQELSVSALVIISSIGANQAARNFYLRTKGEMEKAVRDAYSGNLKFVRPSLLIGYRDEFRFGEIFSIVFMKAFGWLLSGSFKKYRSIHAHDVAKAMIKAVQLPANRIILESDELQRIAT